MKNNSSKKIYDSNPFTLSFKALGKLFENNALWAVGFIGLAVIWFFMQLFGQIFQAILSSPQTTTTTAGSSNGSVDTAAVVIIIVVVVALVFAAVVLSTAISTFIRGLFSYVALESNQGRSVTASQGFNRTLHRFWPLFKAQLLAGLKIFGWTLLFIIPGIIAFYRYAALPFVVMAEEETSARKIHARTKLLVKKRLWELFGISFVTSIIPVVGGLLNYTGTAALYQQMQLSTDGKLEKPKVHWLNYLGIILLGSFVIMALFIAAIVVIVIQASS